MREAASHYRQFIAQLPNSNERPLRPGMRAAGVRSGGVRAGRNPAGAGAHVRAAGGQGVHRGVGGVQRPAARPVRVGGGAGVGSCVAAGSKCVVGGHLAQLLNDHPALPGPPAQGRTDHGGCVSSAGPACRTGDAALLVGAILPQLLESTVLQDVDVTDLQPGLGRDLDNRPTLDIPAVDDDAPGAGRASSTPAAPLRAWIPAPAGRANFHLTYRGTWRDNGPVLPVAAVRRRWR